MPDTYTDDEGEPLGRYLDFVSEILPNAEAAVADLGQLGRSDVRLFNGHQMGLWLADQVEVLTTEVRRLRAERDAAWELARQWENDYGDPEIPERAIEDLREVLSGYRCGHRPCTCCPRRPCPEHGYCVRAAARVVAEAGQQ